MVAEIAKIVDDTSGAIREQNPNDVAWHNWSQLVQRYDNGMYGDPEVSLSALLDMIQSAEGAASRMR